MTDERSQRAVALFSHLITLPVDERAAFLERERGADPALLAAVNQLLADDQEAEHQAFLSTNTFHLRVQAASSSIENEPSRDELIGREIGAYRVEELIGQGGMGRVYRARRIRDYEQTVAIKFIQATRASAELATLFQNEMKLHARVSQHPHIVRLLDAGLTSEQLPYLVMEFVQGMRLDAYCNQHQLDWRARLGLFHQVCLAVAFAHQQLVIHRDLKPSNILVDEKGEPKLMDFGIAQADWSADERTQSLVRAFTREYASPEQLRGEPLDTRTDIYSLGVILYLLVTGQRPFETATPHEGQEDSADSTDLNERICKSTPVRPSQLFRSQRKRGSTSPSGKSDSGFRRALLDDLDAIALKALAKHPSERYATVAELASDIQRALDGEPVQARRQTTFYVVSKFARRNRPLVAAVTLIVLSLLVGITGTAIGMRRAKQERQRAEENLRVALNTVDDLFSTFGALHLANEPRLQEVRKKLLEQAITHFTRIAERSTEPNQRDSQMKLAVALHGLGMVATLQGDTEEALSKFQAALAIREKLARESPNDPNSQRDLAISLGMLARTWRVDGKIKLAGETYQRVRQILEVAMRDKPREPQSLKDMAVLIGQMGLFEREYGDQEAARALFQQELDQWDSLCQQHPEEMDYVAGRVRAAINLATAQDRLRDRASAMRTLNDARKSISELEEAEYSPDDTMKSLATVENNLAQIALKEGQLELADGAFQRAVDAGRKLVAPNPTSSLMLDLASSLTNYGLFKVDMTQLDQALELLVEVRSIWARCRQVSPENPRFPFELACTNRRIGATLLDAGRPAEAQQSFEEDLKVLQEALPILPDVKLLRIELPRGRLGLAKAILARDQTSGVAEILELAASEASRLQEKAPKDTDVLFLAADLQDTFGELYRRTSEPDKMRSAWEKAVEIMETVAVDVPNHPLVRQKLSGLKKRLGDK